MPARVNKPGPATAGALQPPPELWIRSVLMPAGGIAMVAFQAPAEETVLGIPRRHQRGLSSTTPARGADPGR